MEIKVREESSNVFIKIIGNVDERGAEQIKTRFRQLDVSSLQKAVFDFSDIEYIGSAGIGKFLLFYKDLAGNGGELRIENASAPVYDLFKTLKLDTIFSVTKA